MTFKQFKKDYYIDEIIFKGLAIKDNILKLNFDFCEWQLEELQEAGKTAKGAMFFIKLKTKFDQSEFKKLVDEWLINIIEKDNQLIFVFDLKNDCQVVEIPFTSYEIELI